MAESDRMPDAGLVLYHKILAREGKMPHFLIPESTELAELQRTVRSWFAFCPDAVRAVFLL